MLNHCIPGPHAMIAICMAALNSLQSLHWNPRFLPVLEFHVYVIIMHASMAIHHTPIPTMNVHFHSSFHYLSSSYPYLIPPCIYPSNHTTKTTSFSISSSPCSISRTSSNLNPPSLCPSLPFLKTKKCSTFGPGPSISSVGFPPFFRNSFLEGFGYTHMSASHRKFSASMARSYPSSKLKIIENKPRTGF